MKKNLPMLFYFFLFTTLATAQIPNGDFESWKDEFPVGYITTKYSADELLIPSNVNETNDAYAGSAAILIETIAFENFFTGDSDTLSGVAYTGDKAKNIIGFPFALKPTSFSGYYKTHFESKDTAKIILGLYKWNETKMKRDSIGGVVFMSDTNVNAYAHFFKTVDYINTTDIPDTAIIYLSSSSSIPIPGSMLTIDNLMINEVITATSANQSKNHSLAFPNPAVDRIYFKDLSANATKIEIRDMTGTLKEELEVKNNAALEVSNYASGIYHYSVKSQDGNVLYGDKFSVIK